MLKSQITQLEHQVKIYKVKQVINLLTFKGTNFTLGGGRDKYITSNKHDYKNFSKNRP